MQIGFFYLDKNNRDHEVTTKDIESLRIRDLVLVNPKKLKIFTARPGLILGRRGQNLDALQKHLNLEIEVEECDDWLVWLIPSRPDDYMVGEDCDRDEPTPKTMRQLRYEDRNVCEPRQKKISHPLKVTMKMITVIVEATNRLTGVGNFAMALASWGARFNFTQMNSTGEFQILDRGGIFENTTIREWFTKEFKDYECTILQSSDDEDLMVITDEDLVTGEEMQSFLDPRGKIIPKISAHQVVRNSFRLNFGKDCPLSDEQLYWFRDYFGR